MQNLERLTGAKTRSLCAENVTGAKGGGGKDAPVQQGDVVAVATVNGEDISAMEW